MRFDYGQMLQKWLFVRKIRVKSRCTAQNKKKSAHHGTNFNQYSVVRGHDRLHSPCRKQVTTADHAADS